MTDLEGVPHWSVSEVGEEKVRQDPPAFFKYMAVCELNTILIPV